jgi:hypothetical protein
VRVLELGGKTGEPQLGTLAEAALEAPSLRIPGEEQPAAGGFELGSLRSHVPPKSGIRRCEACGPPDGVDDAGVADDFWVVDEYRDRFPVALDRRHGPVGSLRR